MTCHDNTHFFKAILTHITTKKPPFTPPINGETPWISEAISIYCICNIYTSHIIIVGDTFGLPGSASYRIYENFNRLMAILKNLLWHQGIDAQTPMVVARQFIVQP